MPNTKKKSILLGYHRRQDIQKKKTEKNVSLIREYLYDILSDEFLAQSIASNKDLEQIYIDIYEKIDQLATSNKILRIAYKAFIKRIQQFNVKYNKKLPLPSRSVSEIKRSSLVYNSDWFEFGKKVCDLANLQIEYWKTETSFTFDDIIANILLSAVLYSGLNQRYSLDALLHHLRQPSPTKSIFDGTNIIFLEVISPHYGDIYIKKEIDTKNKEEIYIKKSRNFVPDYITQLWLVRFYLYQQENQEMTCYINGDETAWQYIEKFLIKLNGRHSGILTYTQLLRAASYHWQQLKGVKISAAMVQILQEEILSCGLSLQSFDDFYRPQVDPDIEQKLLKKVDISTEKKFSNPSVISSSNNQFKDIHKFLLNLIRTKTKDVPDKLIADLLENHNEYHTAIIRLMMWLIALYKKPAREMLELLNRFDIEPSSWDEFIRPQNTLRPSSIYTYYSKVAEPFLVHAYDSFQSDESDQEEQDFNDRLFSVYQLFLDHTKKSEDQKYKILKRFHWFQRVFFKAPPFRVETIKGAARPRPQYLSAQLFALTLRYLKIYLQENAYASVEINILFQIYTIAYRTGMRINEILGLRIKDIEGNPASSIWIRPYSSKKKEDHQLKTDSSERCIPCHILLDDNELENFQKYVLLQREIYDEKNYLFKDQDTHKKLKHHQVTRPFLDVLSMLVPHHNYSFHSLRHSTVNNLSLILNCTEDSDVLKLTHYDLKHIQRIRTQLLPPGLRQDIWLYISHLMGHIDSYETFKSYFHFGYILGGYQLLQYDPEFEVKVIAKILGYTNP
jgi:integrase